MRRQPVPAQHRSVHRAREPKRQVRLELRAPGERDPRNRAAVVLPLVVEIVGFEQPSQKPASFDRPDPGAQGMSCAHERARDSGCVVAEDDRVADAGPPPLVFGGQARNDSAEPSTNGALTGIAKREGMRPETERRVNRGPRVPRRGERVPSRWKGKRRGWVRHLVPAVVTRYELGRKDGEEAPPFESGAEPDFLVPTATRPHRTIVERERNPGIPHRHDFRGQQGPAKPRAVSGKSGCAGRYGAKVVAAGRRSDESPEPRALVGVTADGDERREERRLRREV